MAFNVLLFSQGLEATDAFFLKGRFEFYPVGYQIPGVSSDFREKRGCSAQAQVWPWPWPNHKQSPDPELEHARVWIWTFGLDLHEEKGQMIQKHSCSYAL